MFIILHFANIAGEKENIRVIRKDSKPRAFKNININNLPVTWKYKRKVWMAELIMKEWLPNLDWKTAKVKNI